MATIEQLQKQSGFFTTMLILIIAILVVGVLLARVQIGNVIKVNKEVAGNTAALDAYKKKIENLDKLKENYLKLENQVPDFRKVTLGTLPDQPDEERFLIYLRNLTNQAGVPVSAVRISSVEDSLGIKALNLDISLSETDWGSLIRFFGLLESGSRIVQTTTVSLQGNVLVRPEIKMKLFYRPLEVGSPNG